MKTPVQLTEDFTFVPLPEGLVLLPNCGKSPDDKPSSVPVEVQNKFWVPKSPLETVVCELSAKNNCGVSVTVKENYFVIPCHSKSGN